MRDIQKENRIFRKRNLTYILIFLVLSSLFYFYRNSSPVSFFQETLFNIFSTPREAIYNLGRKEKNAGTLTLKKQNEELIKKLADYELMKRDNEAYKSQFDEATDYSQTLLAAKIIGYLGDAKYPSSFVINKGKKQGVAEGMAVVSKKFLVGKIIKAGDNYSVVTTPVNTKFSTLAKLTDTNANGIVSGKNDLMVFERVVITDILKKDGIVVTKGEVNENGIGILPDIIIGKITSVSKNETEPFQSAEVLPVIDYAKLTTVFVVKSM